MYPSRPPLTSQARASARFSSLTTATTSTSLSDTSSYWASSQPKRNKYRSYASSSGTGTGNEGVESPGTDMTSPGMGDAYKFERDGEEKGSFPGIGVVAGSEETQTAEQVETNTLSSEDGHSQGVNRMLDEEIHRLSSVSSSSRQRPISMISNVPSLYSGTTDSDEPATTASTHRQRRSSLSPSRPSTSQHPNRHSRPPRRMTHTLFPAESPSSELAGFGLDSPFGLTSRRAMEEGLSTIKEERKNSLSILEGHGRNSTTGTETVHGSRISSRDGVMIVGNALSGATAKAASVRPLSVKSSPALRDRISMFEGRSNSITEEVSSREDSNGTVDPIYNSSPAPTTPKSGYFAKKRESLTDSYTSGVNGDVADLFSPAKTDDTERSGSGHLRMAAEGQGSPWMVSTPGTIRIAASRNLSPWEAPFPVLRNEGDIQGVRMNGAPTSTVKAGSEMDSPGLAKRSSLTRTPTRARNLVGQYDLDKADTPSKRPITPSALGRGLPAMPATPTRMAQMDIHRMSGLAGMAPRRISGPRTELSDRAENAEGMSHSRTFSKQYLDSKPLPPLGVHANAIPAYATPPRSSLSSSAQNSLSGYGISSTLASTADAAFSAYARSRNITPTRPTLLSNSFGPVSTDSILIPTSPSRASGGKSSPFSTSGRSPLSKSPLKDLMGVFSNVKEKVKAGGRKRAGTWDKGYPDSHLHVDQSAISSYALSRRSSEDERPSPGEREVRGAIGRAVVEREEVALASQSMVGSQLPAFQPTPGSRRESQAVYLQPTPCSSISRWGEWEPCHAILMPSYINFRSYASDGAHHDLDLATCAEVRSLRQEEARRKGLPEISNEDGADWWRQADRVEMLELIFGDGNRVYMGVEGISGRLGWVTALWDVILACRTEPTALPPPSPVVSSRVASGRFIVPASLARAETARINASSDPRGTVNAVSDHTIPASATSARPQYGRALPQIPVPSEESLDEDILKENVKQLLSIGPNGSPVPQMATRNWVIASEGEADGSVKEEWVPAERQLSVFGAVERIRPASVINSSRLASNFSPQERPGEAYSAADLSFDENDLNPSRSASQRRPRSPTVLGRSDPVQPGAGIVPIRQPARKMEPQPLTTADLLPWKRAPKVLSMPAPLAGSSLANPFPPPRNVEQPDMADVSSFLQGPDLQKSADQADHVSDVTEKPSLSQPVPGGPLIFRGSSLRNLPTTVESSNSSIVDDLEAAAAKDHVSKLTFAQQPRAGLIPSAVQPRSPDLLHVVEGIQRSMATSEAQEASSQGLHELNGKVDGMHMDVREFRDLITTATSTLAKNAEATPIDLEGIHTKLDSIVSTLKDKASQPMSAEPAETSGEEAEPKREIGDDASAHPNDDVVKQLSEVLTSVKDLQAARDTQTQQTADMATYLAQLNGWLEKFVTNGTTEIQSMASKVDRLTRELAPEAPPRDPNAPEGLPEPIAAQGLPGLVREVHGMAMDQQRRAMEEGMVVQRVDALLAMLGEDRQRSAQQQSTFDSVLQLLERQRAEHEHLLRALATDLTSEIRGEKVKFIEAMRDATSVNVNLHVEDFKKMLNQEVVKNMHELAAMREQKKGLELVISDLFAIKAKHTDVVAMPARASPAPAPSTPPATPNPARHARSPAPAGHGPRSLPKAPM